MTGQETADNQQSTHRKPMVRPISWIATIPQFIALTTTVSMGWLFIQSSVGVFLGAAAYLIYSIGSQHLIPSAHRRAVRLIQSNRFEEAIQAYTESYEFFTRHAWLDRYRALTMMSPRRLAAVKWHCSVLRSRTAKSTRATWQRPTTKERSLSSRIAT